MQDWIIAAGAKLDLAGIEEARREARLLLEESIDLDLNEQFKYPGRVLSEEELAILNKNLERRCGREPFTSIFAKAYFYGYEFSLNEACLAPRPETELLVDFALSLCKNWPVDTLALAELCCGSGAPGISLLLEVLKEGKKAKLDLLDISAEALFKARENAEKHRVMNHCRFWHRDLFPPREEGPVFDIILVNPPYIKREEIPLLMPEVREHERHLALDGGPDGLDFYRRLAQGVSCFMKPQAWLILEHGKGQAEEIVELFSCQEDVQEIIRKNDYAGHDRMLAIQYK